jgi:hypothetical protein
MKLNKTKQKKSHSFIHVVTKGDMIENEPDIKVIFRGLCQFAIKYLLAMSVSVIRGLAFIHSLGACYRRMYVYIYLYKIE